MFNPGLLYFHYIHYFTSISIVLVHLKKGRYRLMDQPTERWKDGHTPYRDGWTHLKTEKDLP